MKAYDRSVDFPLVPSGSQPVRCVQIIDMGTSLNEYNGKDQHKIFLGMEAPNTNRRWTDKEGVDHEEPFIVGQFFTLSLNSKAKLRQFIEGWFGKQIPEETIKAGFDMKVLLDRTAYVHVIHKAKTNGNGMKAEIASVMPLPPEIICPARRSHSTYFSLDKDEFSLAVFQGLPQYFRTMIEKSVEWAELNGLAPATAAAVTGSAPVAEKDFDDDIPF
jgi:hypothetical protein